MLKVVVVQGKRLVIRDFKSSDPYVIVKLGNQVSLIFVNFVSTCFNVNAFSCSCSFQSSMKRIES